MSGVLFSEVRNVDFSHHKIIGESGLVRVVGMVGAVGVIEISGRLGCAGSNFVRCELLTFRTSQDYWGIRLGSGGRHGRGGWGDWDIWEVGVCGV